MVGDMDLGGGLVMSRKRDPRTGNVYAIPICDGTKYVFARMFRDADLEIFKHCSDTPTFDTSFMGHRLYVATVTDEAIKSGAWKKVGQVPFDRKEDEWPPARKSFDVIGEEYEIVERGGYGRPASKEETEGLFPYSVDDSKSLVEEIEIRLGFREPGATHRMFPWLLDGPS
jgi:hypothetical protein